MRPILRRELFAYLRTPLGWIILAAVLLVDGLLFNVQALAGERRSSAVLARFFYFASGTTLVASVPIAMRLFAEEWQTGTAPFLLSAPVGEVQIVLGKFLAAWMFQTLVTLSTAYIPLLIFVHGSVTLGHIVAGYVGLLLLSAAALAIGALASALAPTQILAALIACLLLGLLLVLWWVGQASEPPLSDVASHLALYQRHFPPFMSGMISTASVAYYLSVTFVFLFAAVRALEASRWR